MRKIHAPTDNLAQAFFTLDAKSLLRDMRNP